MRTIALIEDADVVERMLTPLKIRDPLPDTHSPAGPVRLGLDQAQQQRQAGVAFANVKDMTA